MSEKSIEEMGLPSNIVELVDSKGSRVYPLSHTKGIVDDLGRTLDEIFTLVGVDVIDKVERLIQGAPEEHDTLIEISQALKDNESASAAVVRLVTEAKTKVAELELAMEGYITQESADSRYALKSVLGDYIKSSSADLIYLRLDGLDSLTLPASAITIDDEHNFVSTTEKNTWNGKISGSSSLEVNAITKSLINHLLALYTDKQDKSEAWSVWTGTQAAYDAMKNAGTLPANTIFGIEK